jgi:OmpA family
MANPFGPGEIKVFPPNPSSNVRGLSAALDNFGIDQSGLKNEHKKWLDENVVPAMRADPATRVFLRGSASKSGANDYNMKLSKRRAESVRDHLVQRNISLAQISVAFTGEELAQGTIDESSVDRAVFLLLGDVPAARFREFTQFAGFDDTTLNRPPWQMVPFMGSVLVRLDGDDGSFSLDCVSIVNGLPSIKVQATRITRGLVSLLGRFPGKAQIQTRDALGNVLARLDVSVKFHREFTVALHRVQDSAQPPREPAGGRRNFQHLCGYERDVRASDQRQVRVD